MGTGIENGNRLGNRPVVRQSKIYRTNESGNAMKDLLGQGHLSWNEDQQEGVFKGQAVYDAASGTYQGSTAQSRQGCCFGGPAAVGGSLPQQPPQGQGGERCCFGGPAALEQRRVSFAPAPVAPATMHHHHHQQQQQQQQRQQQVVVGACGGSMSLADEDGTAEYPHPGSVASCDGCGQVVPRFYHCLDCREETGLFDLCVACCHAVYMHKGPGGPTLRIDHPTHQYETHRMEHVVPTA
jgi:hypothetical protein